MTLKCSEGHGKWYEWVKLSEYYHHAKTDLYIYCINAVQENCNIKVVPT